MAGNRISHAVVALSSAAILAVYAAGYKRTSEAAKRFSEQDERHPITPVRSSFVAPAQALPPLVPGELLPSPREVSQANGAPRGETRLRESSAPAATVARFEEGSFPAESVAPATASSVGSPVAVSVNVEPAPTPVPEPAPAPAPVLAAAPAPAADITQVSPYKDGTYKGWGSCRHGDIEATVVIESGRIASANISQCYTRYPCSWISNAPGQVVSRQSLDVDYVSGATQSINAFRDAVYEALSKSK